MHGVMRDLQILLEQSKLWKGELARHSLSGPSSQEFGIRASDVLGKFYG
jgi:hypothetical protein